MHSYSFCIFFIKFLFSWVLISFNLWVVWLICFFSQHSSSIGQRDREGLTALDLVMKDRLPHVEFVHSGSYCKTSLSCQRYLKNSSHQISLWSWIVTYSYIAIWTGLSEVFTWGTNSNFTLGHENLQRKKIPETVEFFRKQSVNIKIVSIHSPWKVK